MKIELTVNAYFYGWVVLWILDGYVCWIYVWGHILMRWLEMCHLELILITTVFRVIRFIPAGCTIKYLFLIFKILFNTLIIKLALGLIPLLCWETGDVAGALVIRLQDFEFNRWVLWGLVISVSLAELDTCMVENLGGGELSYLLWGFYKFTVVIDTLFSYALIIT